MIRLWHWIMDNMQKVYLYGSIVVCLLLLIVVLAGFGNSPRWGNFQ